jgi:hypothetical protein
VEICDRWCRHRGSRDENPSIRDAERTEIFQDSISPGGSRWMNRGSPWPKKAAFENGLVLLSPAAASRILVQSLRATTGCEVDLARKRPRSCNQAQTSDTETATGVFLSHAQMNRCPTPEPIKHAAVLGPVKAKPLGVAAEDAASLDTPCARRCVKYTVGTEECSRRGSNKRMDPRRQVTGDLILRR